MTSQSLSKHRRVSCPSSRIYMFHLLPDKISWMHPQLALPCKKSYYSSSFTDTWACSWTLWSSRLPIVPRPVLVPPESLGRNHSFQFILDDNISKAANRLCSYFLGSSSTFYFLSTPTCFSFLSTSEESRRYFSLASSASAGIPQPIWTWWQENSVLGWLFDYSVRLNVLVLLDRHNDWKGFPVMVAFKK